MAVANRFEAIAAGRVSERDGAVFREFLRAVAPTVCWASVSRQSDDLLVGRVSLTTSQIIGRAPRECRIITSLCGRACM